MLADITVKVSEFQASGRKLEQNLIYLRALQKNFTADERQKLTDLINSIDAEVERIFQFIENDKKSRGEGVQTNQFIAGSYR
jgi:DNA replication initiation complex subunit (GINS family)